MRDVPSIIKACGGPEKIEAASGTRRRPGKRQTIPVLSHWAVRKWPSTGIPERHWPLLMKLRGDLTLDELHTANEAVRAKEAA
jgi:hypothetical protein